MGAIPPQNLGPDIGSLWLTGTAFNEFDMSLVELYWDQHIIKDRLAFRFGKTIPFAIHDYFKYKSPVSGFQDSNFTLNSSIAWVGFGLGAVGLVRPTSDIYVLAESTMLRESRTGPASTAFSTMASTSPLLTSAGTRVIWTLRER
jgi:hypothetical protein